MNNTLPQRLRASVKFDAVHSLSADEREICGRQMIEAATTIEMQNSAIAKQAKEISELRAALLPFGKAASRPGRLVDPMSPEQPLPDDAVTWMGVPVSAWKRAAELTGVK